MVYSYKKVIAQLSAVGQTTFATVNRDGSINLYTPIEEIEIVGVSRKQIKDIAKKEILLLRLAGIWLQIKQLEEMSVVEKIIYLKEDIC